MRHPTRPREDTITGHDSLGLLSTVPQRSDVAAFQAECRGFETRLPLHLPLWVLRATTYRRGRRTAFRPLLNHRHGRCLPVSGMDRPSTATVREEGAMGTPGRPVWDLWVVVVVAFIVLTVSAGCRGDLATTAPAPTPVRR